MRLQSVLAEKEILQVIRECIYEEKLFFVLKQNILLSGPDVYIISIELFSWNIRCMMSCCTE